jgi:chemotaxis protein methyltransferase CheR
LLHPDTVDRKKGGKSNAFHHFFNRFEQRKLEAMISEHKAMADIPEEGFDLKFRAPVMSDDVFHRLSGFIKETFGIKLPLFKKTMLEGRLRKRMRALDITSFEQYCQYLFSPRGYDCELIHMINVVTTNKTDFFREPDHFDYLVHKVLPEMIDMQAFGGRKKLGVWSAGCSTGEEPYTLAMVLANRAERCPGLEFSVLATDISTAVLEKARKGIYREEDVRPVPMDLRKKYLLRCKNRENKLVRIAPELRALVKFQRLNFMEEKYRMGEDIKIIFCRNVIIYFDRPTQEKIIGRLSLHLCRGGYLFIGHSESLHGMDLPLTQTAATVYRKV